MQEQTKSKQMKIISTWVLFFSCLFLLFALIANSTAINAWSTRFLRLLRPVLLGAAVAYVSNPIFRFFERRALARVNPPALRRWLSLFTTYLVLLLAVALLLLSIIPQLMDSVDNFLARYDSYFAEAVHNVNGLLEQLNATLLRFSESAAPIAPLDEAELRERVSAMFGSEATNLIDFLANVSLEPVVEALYGFVSWGADIIFGVLIATYLLATKEKLYAQIMKLRRAFFSPETNVRLTRIFTAADRSFGGFLEGKILDSLIIGLLTYVVLLLFRIPYAIMIAVFVGVTNIIPVIGPFVGAIPTGFIILLTDPSKVLTFLIIILVVQQIDGNIIGPKILGDNTGVSSLCVIISITVMGSIWGFLGMLLGVPLFATVLEVLEGFFSDLLQKKGLPSALDGYYAPDAVMNPAKQSEDGTDKLVKRLERAYLHTEWKRYRDPSYAFSKQELLTRKTYDRCLKLRLFSPPAEEQLVHSSAEFATDEMRRAEKEYLNEHFPIEKAPSENESRKEGV